MKCVRGQRLQVAGVWNTLTKTDEPIIQFSPSTASSAGAITEAISSTLVEPPLTQSTTISSSQTPISTTFETFKSTTTPVATWKDPSVSTIDSTELPPTITFTQEVTPSISSTAIWTLSVSPLPTTNTPISASIEPPLFTSRTVQSPSLITSNTASLTAVISTLPVPTTTPSDDDGPSGTGPNRALTTVLSSVCGVLVFIALVILIVWLLRRSKHQARCMSTRQKTQNESGRAQVSGTDQSNATDGTLNPITDSAAGKIGKPEMNDIANELNDEVNVPVYGRWSRRLLRLTGCMDRADRNVKFEMVSRKGPQVR